ncbi:hypothetical protein CKO14_07950 [Halorhodospira halophila]|nr:hypothetical protein [Halorhodospira halophila]
MHDIVTTQGLAPEPVSPTTDFIIEGRQMGPSLIVILIGMLPNAGELAAYINRAIHALQGIDSGSAAFAAFDPGLPIPQLALTSRVGRQLVALLSFCFAEVPSDIERIPLPGKGAHRAIQTRRPVFAEDAVRIDMGHEGLLNSRNAFEITADEPTTVTIGFDGVHGSREPGDLRNPANRLTISSSDRYPAAGLHSQLSERPSGVEIPSLLHGRIDVAVKTEHVRAGSGSVALLTAVLHHKEMGTIRSQPIFIGTDRHLIGFLINVDKIFLDAEDRRSTPFSALKLMIGPPITIRIL